MELISVANVSNFSEGSMKKVNAEGVDLLLANVEGKFYALADRCPHLGASLSNGSLEGSTIKCAKHGAQFDIKTGKSLGQAKIFFMKTNVHDAKSYRVEVRGSEIFVELG